jgi:hypothetical protein
MSDLGRDPIVNVVQNQIKKGIRITLDNECYSSVVILTYSGIDTMAFLNMPASQVDVTRDDFVQWVDTYLKFPCQEQISGLEFYGARCAMLHTFTTSSRLSRSGQIRQIGYMDKSVPEIRYDSSVSKDLVLVSIAALAESFLQGVDRFLIDVFSDSNRIPVVEERLRNLVHQLPQQETGNLE